MCKEQRIEYLLSNVSVDVSHVEFEIMASAPLDMIRISPGFQRASTPYIVILFEVWLPPEGKRIKAASTGYSASSKNSFHLFHLCHG